jgi:hypothetical protein
VLRHGLLKMAETLHGLERRLDAVDREIIARGRDNATFRHPITAPGYGPILSSAMAALVVAPEIWPRPRPVVRRRVQTSFHMAELCGQTTSAFTLAGQRSTSTVKLYSFRYCWMKEFLTFGTPSIAMA